LVEALEIEKGCRNFFRGRILVASLREFVWRRFGGLQQQEYERIIFTLLYLRLLFFSAFGVRRTGAARVGEGMI
jgi:hypothetical protein